MVIDNAAEAADVVDPIVCVATTDHVPSARSEKVQLSLVVVATKVHVDEPPPVRVAVSVTVAPTRSEPVVIEGVLSLVALSVELDPRSDAASRSGVPGDDVPTAVSAFEIEVAVPLAFVATAEYRTYRPTSDEVAV